MKQMSTSNYYYLLLLYTVKLYRCKLMQMFSCNIRSIQETAYIDFWSFCLLYGFHLFKKKRIQNFIKESKY